MAAIGINYFFFSYIESTDNLCMCMLVINLAHAFIQSQATFIYAKVLLLGVTYS